MKTNLLALAAAVGLIASAAPLHAADAPASDAEFNAQGCNACHVKGEADQAPPLEGVYGRKIAGAPNWPYCDALKAKTGTWDDAKLNEFLKDTQAFAPGCAMVFKIDDPKKREAIISYLKTLH